ncbi:MAG: hypothetical protein JNM74_13795 [Myxococcales bacterium]|nr:hypothetical protein [Myxococcales bacterium]
MRMSSRGIVLVFSATSALLALGSACSSTSSTDEADAGTTNDRTSFGAEQQNGGCRAQPEKLTGTAGPGTACQTFADCAPVCCACSVKGSNDGYSAAACINGACVGADVACPVAKKADYCPLDPAPTPNPTGDGGPSPDGAPNPTNPPNPANAAFCVPISSSHATDRGAVRLATTAAYVKQLSTAPGAGSLNVTRDSAGRPTYISYGGTPGYTVSLTYDSAGNLTYLRRSPSGSAASDTHTFSYDSKNKLTYFRKSWSDSQPSETESLSYDSSSLPTYYRQSWSDSTPSQTETLSFDSAGMLTYWRRSWSDSKPSETETFSYDSDKRLTSWRRSWSDSTPTDSASLSYSGNSRLPSSVRTDGAGAAGATVIDCKR